MFDLSCSSERSWNANLSIALCLPKAETLKLLHQGLYERPFCIEPRPMCRSNTMKRRTCSKFTLIGPTIGVQAKEPPRAEDVSFSFGFTKNSVDSVCTASNELFTSWSDVERLTSNRLMRRLAENDEHFPNFSHLSRTRAETGGHLLNFLHPSTPRADTGEDFLNLHHLSKTRAETCEHFLNFHFSRNLHPNDAKQ